MNSLAFLSVEPQMLKTEERIIRAAMQVFSRYPIDAVTLRMIANEAEVTLSLITYHFKTKENLYQEVLGRVLTFLAKDIQPYFELLDIAKPLEPQEARRLLAELVDFVAERIYSGSKSVLLAKFIIQEHFSPSPAYEFLYKEFFEKVLDLLTRIVTAITGLEDRHRASLQAFSILGQLFGFRLERELMVRFLGLKGFSEAETKELKEVVLRNTFAQLDALTAASPLISK